MCGRYRLTAKERYLRDHFGLVEDFAWSPRWNIAPTQQVPVIRQDRREPKRTFRPLSWGLIPFWAKDRSIAAKTINAMSETAAEKPAFRDAMRFRRCLVPADGFYEWAKIGSNDKQAYNFGRQDDTVFAFAGLWDHWRDPAGEMVETFTILTTKPNMLVADVHDRMPAIVRKEDYELWLDPGITDPSRIAECLLPFSAALRKKYPVSSRVNRPANDDELCAQEVSIQSTTPTLF